MKVIDFSKTNSILNQYISEIRNVEVQNDRLRFRRNIERIGEIMAYEMSKELAYSIFGKKHPDTTGSCSGKYTGQQFSYQHYLTCRPTLPSGLLELFRWCGECVCFRIP